ncbi:hypothetical protein N7517_009117 [Penicillium concentricum]|uniref:Uncharacterized protein n=1 Tax=Penicillium concentricum TaxID=293559 RepID=A0A9W9RGY0_9EURO|nr:uncharacterized protein N7517_009117 [Penicillium concentricum]KAJ5359926.1 hypothetical protein N7517_009117 [Penicillium concentricum]
MPFYQASVFQSSQLEHGTRFHFRDPHNSQLGWIWGNVALPDTMSIATDDREIIVHTRETIKAGLVTWTTNALHGLGNMCISFPIKIEVPDQGAEILMLQVEIVALWYEELIAQGIISIDKHMLFLSREGPSEREDQLLVEPVHWNKPQCAVANPWSAPPEVQDEVQDL